ncbi:KH domain-containing protein HEN4, partial [Mucuna pruriens]
MVAGINSRGINDVGRGLTSRKGGLELVSGSKTAIVTNTTVQIVVPDDVIGSVYGENGSNLVRLRQISGAKVIVHEPRPGTSERTIVISGTPDETRAAQSLLQAFILTGSS